VLQTVLHYSNQFLLRSSFGSVCVDSERKTFAARIRSQRDLAAFQSGCGGTSAGRKKRHPRTKAWNLSLWFVPYERKVEQILFMRNVFIVLMLMTGP